MMSPIQKTMQFSAAIKGGKLFIWIGSQKENVKQ